MSDRRARLEALRDVLADAIAVADPNMLPQLAGQYRATLADLDGLPHAAEQSRTDELRDRRAKRKAG